MIKEINASDPEANSVFYMCYQNSLPLVIRGLYADSHAVKVWDIDYLQSKKSLNEKVHVTNYKVSDDNERQVLSRRDSEIPFGELIRYIKEKPFGNDEICNMYSHSVLEHFNDLLKDISIPPLLEKYIKPEQARVWLGMRRNLSQTHFDNINNLFFQIKGVKRFVFYPASHYYYLYHSPATRRINMSEVNAQRPDWEKHPLFKLAKPHTIDLHPGDLLYLPPFWWHEVESLDNYISLNFMLDLRLDQFFEGEGLNLLTYHYEKNDLYDFLVFKKKIDSYANYKYLDFAHLYVYRGLNWAGVLLGLSYILRKYKAKHTGLFNESKSPISENIDQILKTNGLPESFYKENYLVNLELNALKKDNTVLTPDLVNDFLLQLRNKF